MKYVEMAATVFWAAGLFGWMLLVWVFVGAAYANRLPAVPWSAVNIFDASDFTTKGNRYRTQAWRCMVCWVIFSTALPALAAALRSLVTSAP